ncbi:hypothetical protein Psuf_021580 [Phytohabitans suffuscus]|uniref:Transposase IS4-like domain-containing protein n=1 Tax=Phytohabitans suffuscus TaxID=624315 RepID=A0A6F8YFE4_9ACTN|nr:hypothetical protein Psuf_021580 [Phytohabitans suffuscus]
MRLYLLATAEGMPILWCLANPKLDEREVMTALIDNDHQLITSGQVILADRGFAGPEFERFCDEAGIHLVRPKRTNAKSDPPRTPAERALLRCRQWIESISKPSKVNCRWNVTALAAKPDCSPGSVSACSPSPQ